jgi:hypothetical protein
VTGIEAAGPAIREQVIVGKERGRHEKAGGGNAPGILPGTDTRPRAQ